VSTRLAEEEEPILHFSIIPSWRERIIVKCSLRRQYNTWAGLFHVKTSNGRSLLVTVPLPEWRVRPSSIALYAILFALAGTGTVDFKLNYELVKYKPVELLRTLEKYYPFLLSRDPADAILTRAFENGRRYPYVIGPLTVSLISQFKRFVGQVVKRPGSFDLQPFMHGRVVVDGKKWPEIVARETEKHYPRTARMLGRNSIESIAGTFESFADLAWFEHAINIFERQDYNELNRILRKLYWSEKHGRPKIRFAGLVNDKLVKVTVLLSGPRGGLFGEYTGRAYFADFFYFLFLALTGRFYATCYILKNLDRYVEEHLGERRGEGIRVGLYRNDERLFPVGNGRVVICTRIEDCRDYRISYNQRMIYKKNSYFRTRDIVRLPVSMFRDWRRKLGAVLTNCVTCSSFTLFNPHFAVDEDGVVGFLVRKNGRIEKYQETIVGRFRREETRAMIAAIRAVAKYGYEIYDTRGLESVLPVVERVRDIYKVLEKRYGSVGTLVIGHMKYDVEEYDQVKLWISVYTPDWHGGQLLDIIFVPAEPGTDEYYSIIEKYGKPELENAEHSLLPLDGETVRELEGLGLKLHEQYNAGSERIAGYEYGNLYVIVRTKTS